MASNLTWICVDAEDSRSGRLNAGRIRAVRAHASRGVRQREREQRLQRLATGDSLCNSDAFGARGLPQQRQESFHHESEASQQQPAIDESESSQRQPSRLRAAPGPTLACDVNADPLELLNSLEEGQLQLLQHMHFPFRMPPTTPGDSLGFRLISVLPALGPHREWARMLPPRLGATPALDDAVLALSSIISVHLQDQRCSTSATQAVRTYGKAVRSMAHTLTSAPASADGDALLASVAMLVLCEMMLGSWEATPHLHVIKHWQGLSTLFMSHKEPATLSTMARAIIYSLWDITYGVAVGSGEASMFEQHRWWSDLDPPKADDTSSPSLSLRKCAHSLTIRLPRLIRNTRALRQSSATPAEITEAFSWARELYGIKDDASEAELLCHAETYSTRDADVRDFCPYSYSFKSLGHFIALIRYWSMRIGITKNWLRIAEMLPSLESSVLIIPSLRQERRRLEKHQLMAWEYGCTVGDFATLWLAKSMLQGWDIIREEARSGCPRALRRQNWTIGKLNHSLNEYTRHAASMEEMDIAAEILVGGPIRGFVADAVRYAGS